MAEFYTTFIDTIEDKFKEIRETQNENIKKAGEIIAKTIMAGGIMQSFGSGHSYAVAIEVSSRAGGLIQARAIKEPAFGHYETVEGVGTLFCEKLNLEPNDCLILTSNSGRNPLVIELAEYVKSLGIPLIAITSLDVSKGMSSRHSSGKHLYDLADVILDNKGVYGDAAITVPGMDARVMGTSSLTSMLLVDCAVLHAIKLMVDQGFTPPVSISKNTDEGLKSREISKEIRNKYKKRLGYF